jgi:hypothetical protein
MSSVIPTTRFIDLQSLSEQTTPVVPPHVQTTTWFGPAPSEQASCSWETSLHVRTIQKELSYTNDTTQHDTTALLHLFSH